MRSYIFILLAIISFVSCQKKIDLKFADTDPKPVFQCEINLDDTVHRLLITSSVGLNSAANFEGISGASVTLNDNFGNFCVLAETSNGNYESPVFFLAEGRTYTLSIDLNGETFTATSTMPYKVNFDDIDFIPSLFGGDSIRFIVPLRQDPAGVDNFYRFKVTINDTIDNAIMIQDDALSDGLLQQQPLFGNEMPSIGDTCEVSLLCIDENTYNYFFGLLSNSPGASATPANPKSNFSGDCLGYFSAQTKQTLVEVAE